MSDFVELQRLFNIVLRRWWLLVVLTSVMAAAGLMISKGQEPVYAAKATVMVGEITQAANVSREDVQISELFAQTYAGLAMRQPVMQGVVEILGLEVSWQELRNQVEVTAVDGTQFVEIRAEASSPKLAESIADEVANHLILLGPASLDNNQENLAESFLHQQMKDTQLSILSGQARIQELEDAIERTGEASRLLALQTEKANLERLVADQVKNYVELSNLTAQDKTPNTLNVIETAHAAVEPVRPRVKLNMLLGSGLGLLLAFGIIFLLEFLGDVVTSPDDLSQFKPLTLLGSTGKIAGSKPPDKIVTFLEPSSPTSETYRMIRNRIRFGSVERPAKSIVITSPEPGSGKSITAANLGIIMAQANLKTILVDADLSHPMLHQIFDAANRPGLADMINDPDTDMRACIQDTAIKNLMLVSSGDVLPGQTERLRSDRIAEILDCLEQMADAIIIDSPPALLTADAMVLSNQADGVILVVRAGKTKRKAVKQTLQDLQEANATLLGCVLNQARKKQQHSYLY